jgi:hypothetical protein
MEPLKKFAAVWGTATGPRVFQCAATLDGLFAGLRPAELSRLTWNKHEGETASSAGNSPNVIHRHYKALVKEADAREFWAIAPETVKSKIAKFPSQAAATA